MLKKILASLASLVLGAGFVIATGAMTADAATTVPAAPDGQCVVNVIHHDAVVEVDHTEYQWTETVLNQAEKDHTEWRFETRTYRPDHTVEQKFVKGYDFITGGSVVVQGHTVSGHWVASSGWHQIPDSVINAYWGTGGIPANLLGGSEASPKGPVNISVYGGPNVTVEYYAVQITIAGDYTDYGPWSDWSTTNPGPSTDTMNVESRIIKDADAVTGGTFYYLHGGSPTTTLTDANWTTDTPGAPWTLVAQRTVVDTEPKAASDENVYGACPSNPCVTAGSTWATEDVAPDQVATGLLFAGPNAKPVDWYHPVTGNLEGVVGSSYTISSASGYQAALVYEIHRQGLAAPDFSDYATISIEPYNNGWAPGQTGTLTVTHTTKVWTSKITSGLGSQADPATIDEMSAIFPANTLISQGLHLGSGSVADQFTVVSAVTGCGDVSFVPSVALCRSAGSTWATEDAAPDQISTGLLFSGPSAPPVDWYHPVTGNLEGIVGSSYTISSASGYQAALVYEIHRQGLAAPDFSDYATVSIEPYNNGWAPGQTGTLTVTHATKVWTSKITSGLGSQSQPATMDQLSAIFPANTLISQGLHLGSGSAAGQFTVVSAVTGCGDVSFVPTVTLCKSAGSTWATEDVAPVQAATGLRFAGPNAKAVDWYHPVTGNLEGVVGSSYTISSASGYHAALVYEIHRQGLASPDFSDYATVSIEPYNNGWAPGQTGTFTVTHATKVWTSKITAGLGSQADPATIDEMSAIFPANTLISQGLHLGSGSVAGQFTVVSSVTGCGSFGFIPFDPPTLASWPTDAVATQPTCASQNGSLTVGDDFGTSFFAEVDYFLNGTKITTPTISLAPGTYTVTASPHTAGDGLTGPASFPITITASTVLCATDLKTLALTGQSPAAWIAIAYGLLSVGLAMLAMRMLRRRGGRAGEYAN